MPRSKVLSDAEVTAYREDGFLVPRFQLPGPMVARLQALAAALIRDNSQLGDEPMACPHVPGSGVQGLRCEPGWLEFPTYPPVLDMVMQLVGPHVILWGTTLFHKPTGLGRIVPWHRDGRYWPITPLENTSVWIAVEDCTTDNGCLRCIRGSHRAREIGQHYRSYRDDVTIPETLEASEYDEAEARDIELEAGQMVIFDVYTAHGSSANHSRGTRTGYAMRYMPATSHYNHGAIPIADSRGGAHHTRPLILVRGEDVTGRNDFSIGHPA